MKRRHPIDEGQRRRLYTVCGLVSLSYLMRDVGRAVGGDVELVLILLGFPVVVVMVVVIARMVGQERRQRRARRSAAQPPV